MPFLVFQLNANTDAIFSSDRDDRVGETKLPQAKLTDVTLLRLHLAIAFEAM